MSHLIIHYVWRLCLFYIPMHYGNSQFFEEETGTHLLEKKHCMEQSAGYSVNSINSDELHNNIRITNCPFINGIRNGNNLTQKNKETIIW